MAHEETFSNPSQEWEEVWLLFSQEGKEALDTAEEILLKLETEPNEAKSVAELFRAMHNFKGMARMMGLSTVEALAHRAEDLVSLVRDEGVALNGDMINLLLEVLDQLRVILERVVVHRQDVAIEQIVGLKSRLETMLLHYAPGRTAFEPLPTSPESQPLAGEPDLFFPELEPVDAEDSSEWAEPVVIQAPPPVAEAVDPATDLGYVQIFLEIAAEVLGPLHTSLETLIASGDPAAQTELVAFVETMRHAAAQIGYDRLVAILDELSTPLPDTEHETHFIRLSQLELRLFEELAVIEEQARSLDPDNSRLLPDITWLFRRWFADRVFTSLAHLREITDELEEHVRGDSEDAPRSSQARGLIETAISLWRTIYHSCLFYRLDQAAHIALALEDLYAQSNQREISAGEALICLSRTYITHVGGAVQAIDEGETPDLSGLEAMYQQVTQSFQPPHPVLDRPEIPPEFKAVATPETVLEADQALQGGCRFYTILADLNADEEIGLAFYNWSQSSNVHLITNVTVYQGNRSLFNFLMATTEAPETLVAALAEIDPQGHHLSLQECRLPDGVDPAGLISSQISTDSLLGLGVQTTTPEPDTGDGPDDFAEIVGELVATHATLRRVTERLLDGDIIDIITQIASQANGDWDLFQQRLLARVQPWEEDLRTLAQVETEIGATLNHLYDAANLSLKMITIDGMVVRVGQVRYVVPVSAIRRIVKPEAAEIIHASAAGQQSLLKLEDALIPIQTLDGRRNGANCLDHLMLVVEKDQQILALTIDELIGQQQVLIQPLHGCLAHIQNASGCALLGEGDVAIVLNLN